jgi:multidrug efflux pump subunit AcrB
VTTRRLADPKQFEQIIVRANADASIVKLADVARVELGSKDYEFMGRINGKPATLVGIFFAGRQRARSRQDRRDRMAAVSQRFPEG